MKASVNASTSVGHRQAPCPGTGPTCSRRRAAAGIAVAITFPLLIPSCARRSRERLTLYSSMDDPILRPILESFTRESGIAVNAVGDTEATKTTGLVQRILSERARPGADAWWSNECLGTLVLSKAGALEAYTSPWVDASLDWGPWWRGADWYGLAGRARAIVSSTRRTPEGGFTIETWARAGRQGLRLGMARPAFGTTRSHVAALLASGGEAWYSSWLDSLKAAHVVLYDGNSAVVRGVARGEIDAGLTDTDDVHAGLANGWDLVMSLATASPPELDRAVPIPATIGLVRGAPRPDLARRFIDFALSEGVERMLVEGPARHAPRRAALLNARADQALPPTISSTPDELERAANRAVEMCEAMLG